MERPAPDEPDYLKPTQRRVARLAFLLFFVILPSEIAAKYFALA